VLPVGYPARNFCVKRPGNFQTRTLPRRFDPVWHGHPDPTAPYPVYGIVQQVSKGHAALSYLVAMVAMLFTAASYAKMSTAYPYAGSTYTYAERTFGGVICFLAGWAMMLDYFLLPLLSVVYSALTTARLVPQIPYFVWVVVFTLGITVINLRGIRVTARASAVMMWIMSGCAALFFVLATRFVIGARGFPGLVSAAAIYHPDSFAFHPLMLGAAIATVSYIGFDAITTFAEDSLHPLRDVAVATIVVCLLQAAICFLTVYAAALVWPDYAAFPRTETAILDIGRRIGGPLMVGTLTLVLLVAGLASALTGQAGASRLLFGMARDGAIPYRVFGYVDPHFFVPTRSIWLMAAISLAGAMLMHFQLAVELVNFGAFVGFILVNLSVIRHHFIGLRQRRGLAVFTSLIFPAAGALICAYIWVSLTSNAKIAGFAWLGLGVLYLAFSTRRFRVPVRHLDFEGTSAAG
jgi:putrescine importer